jgi:uncharacterized protein
MDMAHGYLGDGFGSRGEIDPDGEEGERGRRERNWRGPDADWRERGSTFGSETDRWSDRGARFEDYGRHEGRFGGTSHARSFSAHPDDHYRSWRDRHMSELDRDYQDYCREREQQFHRDFDGWRRQKYGNPQPLRTGMTQSGISHDPTGMTQAAEENSPASGNEQSAMTAATLGTNSEGRTRGRR